MASRSFLFFHKGETKRPASGNSLPLRSRRPRVPTRSRGGYGRCKNPAPRALRQARTRGRGAGVDRLRALRVGALRARMDPPAAPERHRAHVQRLLPVQGPSGAGGSAGVAELLSAHPEVLVTDYAKFGSVGQAFIVNR